MAQDVDLPASFRKPVHVDATDWPCAISRLKRSSPDLNPIEKMWSKVKEFLRTAKARTQEALFNAIAAALKNVTPQDAEGWFTSCGYVPSHS